VLASREQHEGAEATAAGRTALGLALLAALGLGGFVVLVDAPADVSIPWTLAVSRAAAMPFIALVILRTRPAFPAARLGFGIAVVGCIDLLATVLLSTAQTKGDLSVVSVLGGMYPLATVLLAAVVLHERIAPPQVVGVALALGGVGAVAAG
jgi:drug/metabolite transporter (DMT)-like permease